MVGGRAAAGALVLLAALTGLAGLTGCAGAPDVARTVEGEIAQLDQVAAVTVAAPTAARAAVLTVSYDADLDADDLARLSGQVATAAGREYATYRLSLVPVVEPDSALVVGPGFTGSGAELSVLEAWLRETSALLGPVHHEVSPDGQRITVDSGGGVAQDVAEARRMRYGDATTTWVFRTTGGTFTVGGRVTTTDVSLLQAVQRSAGVDGQPAWADAWQLDRRAGHVRLDLRVTLDGGPVPDALFTAARYGPSLAPIVDTNLTALAGTRLPTWVRVLGRSNDVLATWTSAQRAAPGRDPLGRGWDTWLAARARSV